MTQHILNGFTERKEAILGAEPETALQKARRRAKALAGELSKQGAAAASAELCNEAVQALIVLAYERDTDGELCNVDLNGKLYCAPWGTNGRRHFNLRATEAVVLRKHVQALEEQTTPPPLFTYDPAVKDWFLNIFDYPTGDRAWQYWQHYGITGGDYKRIHQTMKRT